MKMHENGKATLHFSSFADQVGTYFHSLYDSLKQQGVFVLPLGWDATLEF